MQTPISQLTSTVNVFNLSTQEERVYVGITAQEAVVAAYAQDQGDLSTWRYKANYTEGIESDKVAAYGDWAAIK